MPIENVAPAKFAPDPFLKVVGAAAAGSGGKLSGRTAGRRG